MFGYIVCNKQHLAEDEEKRYQSVYCGLCKTLEKNYGQLSRFSLNYDMTFLILFLSSLYEPKEEEQEFRCTAHVFRKRKAVTNRYTDYAADMTVALAYYKCMDDWQDEHKHLPHQYSKILEVSYERVKTGYPRQCEAIENGIKELDGIEGNPDSLPDEAINCFGKITSELFVVEQDFWSNSLRNFGYHLGRFIYLMDATMDYEKDKKTGNYNPLNSMKKKPEDMEEPLYMTIGEAMREFEMLPLVQDAHLLRNILYGGVWQQYNAMKNKKNKKVYRKKAKQYHPDLHPDDPNAQKKMNEVNEAYDMLNNPEKYKKAENPYGGSYGNAGQTGNSYGRQNYGGQNYQGGFGGAWDFDFDDIFGFSGRSYGFAEPQAQPGDSHDIGRVIE